MKKVEFILKQFLLKLLLRFGNSKSSKISNADLSHRHIKILLIRLNRIGDALVTTPLITLLRDKLDCEIEVLSDKKNYFIFENNPFVSKTIIFHKGLTGILATRKYISKSEFDVIVDAHDDVSTTVSYLVSLAPVPLKFGLEKSNKIVFTNTTKRLAGTKHHVVERILQLSNLFGINANIQNSNIFFLPKENSFEFAEKFISNNFHENKLLMGVNISAGSPARFWGVEKFQKLLHYLSDKNANIILISPPSDFELAKEISANQYPIFSENEFDKAATMVSKLDLLFTPDTSFVHIASAFEIPVFGLYVKYNTDDVIWYPFKSKYEAVITEEPNFDNLSFDEVLDKFILFFNKVKINYDKTMK